MPKLEVLGGPDRLAFANSLCEEIDSIPLPGFLSPPHSRGGPKPPTYRGEAFYVKDKEGNTRELLLVIISSERAKVENGMVQRFTAILWGICDEFRDLLGMDPTGSWVTFNGELDFMTQTGWLERVES